MGKGEMPTFPGCGTRDPSGHWYSRGLVQDPLHTSPKPDKGAAAIDDCAVPSRSLCMVQGTMSFARANGMGRCMGGGGGGVTLR